MRKLNRKGFTLVELLAVIVILAIVVGIALTTVLPTLKKSRLEAFRLTPNTAADYLEKQYQLSLIGEETSLGGIPLKNDTTKANWDMMASNGVAFAKAGLKAENYITGEWYIDPDTGRACVTLTAATRKTNASAPGQYYDVDTECNAGDTDCAAAIAKSDGCTN